MTSLKDFQTDSSVKRAILGFTYGANYKAELCDETSGCISYSNSTGKRQALQIITLVSITIVLVQQIVLHPLASLTVYLTNWVLMLTVFCALMNALNQFLHRTDDPETGRGLTRLAVTHFACELNLNLNLFVMLVFWPFIYESAVDCFKDNAWHMYHMYVVHSVPFLCSILTFIATDRFVVKASHWKILPVLTMVYALVNYCETVRSGTPLYVILTWEDWKSPALVAGLSVGVAFNWLGLSQLTQWACRPISATVEESEEICELI